MFEYTEKGIGWLEECLSVVRLRPYYVKADGDPWVTFHLYVRNMEIAVSLFKILHVLEVGLRNRVHTKLVESFQTEEWWDKSELLSCNDLDDIAKAKKSLEEHHHLISPGAVVAELNFGFWVNLFHHRYERKLWIPSLRHRFPARFSREFLFVRFCYIKDIRNRIAHHESLIRMDVERDYGILLETIGWISPTLRRWTEEYSDFPQVFARELPKKPLSERPIDDQELS